VLNSCRTINPEPKSLKDPTNGGRTRVLSPAIALVSVLKRGTPYKEGKGKSTRGLRKEKGGRVQKEKGNFKKRGLSTRESFPEHNFRAQGSSEGHILRARKLYQIEKKRDANRGRSKRKDLRLRDLTISRPTRSSGGRLLLSTSAKSTTKGPERLETATADHLRLKRCGGGWGSHRFGKRGARRELQAS